MSRFRTRLIITILALTFGGVIGVRLWSEHGPFLGSLQTQEPAPIAAAPLVFEDAVDPNAILETSDTPIKITQAEPERPAEKTAEDLPPPLLEKLRQEAEDNPHRTPNSLVQFARSISKRMKEAKTDKAYATRFFSDLEACVDFPSAPSVQAFCLSNAGKLAESHPELKTNFNKLSDRTQADVKELLEATKNL